MEQRNAVDKKPGPDITERLRETSISRLAKGEMLVEAADEIERLRAVVAMVNRDRESIENQADWNRRHPSMVNEFVTIHIAGEGAPEELLAALDGTP